MSKCFNADERVELFNLGGINAICFVSAWFLLVLCFPEFLHHLIMKKGVFYFFPPLSTVSSFKDIELFIVIFLIVALLGFMYAILKAKNKRIIIPLLLKFAFTGPLFMWLISKKDLDTDDFPDIPD
jgi:hypothetical protein